MTLWLMCLLLHDRLDVFLRDALQTRHELAPVDRAIVPDDRNSRDATPFNDHVALRCTFDAVHLTHGVAQRARKPEPFVSELVEKSQQAALYRGGCARTAERGNVLHRALADLARIGARAALDARVEAYGFPRDELESTDVSVRAAGHGAEIEGARQQLEIDLVEVDLRVQARCAPEW